MAIKKMTLAFSIGVAMAFGAGCASQPAEKTDAPRRAAPPASASEGAAVTEADTATLMEKRFQEAARSYKVVERDGKTLYCKREKRIGTTIPTMNCLTESELRNQVETMEEYRNRARNSGRCTQGVGCGAGS